MTMTLISTVTVPNGTSVILLSSLPQTYTDLLIFASIRGNDTSGNVYIAFNGSGSSFSGYYLLGTGSSALSSTAANNVAVNALSSATTGTYGSTQIYIPNYAGAAVKNFSVDSVNENNATASSQRLQAGLWNFTNAITSFQMECDSTFAADSTVSIYGILKGSGGATVA